MSKIDMKGAAAKEGDLRVLWTAQIGMRDDYEVSVATPLEGKIVLEALAHYDLFLLKHNIRRDYSNYGLLEVYHNGEWEQWENDECDDIDAFTLDEMRAQSRRTLT